MPSSKDVLKEIKSAYHALANDPPNGVTLMGALVAMDKAIDEIDQLRAALHRLLQSLESDVHGLVDVRAAEARITLEGSQMPQPASLPSWEDCKRAVDAGLASPLDAFIYEYEPVATERAQELIQKCLPSYSRKADEQFRAMLSAALAMQPVETQPAASNDKPGPWWTPTAEVERLMKWCKDANTITLEISTKVLEGLLYDSLLWRKDRAAQTIKPDETSALPRLEYNQHCGECQRNKITVEVFGKRSPDGPRETLCRYEAAVGHVCTKCGRIHDFGSERCAECQTPRLCGVERECLRNRYVRPAVEPAGVRIAPEKPIIDGHPIGCMCHGCHYYRKHPQCKPVKAAVCTCDSSAAGPCPAHT